MVQRLTKKQRGFAQDYLKTGNGSLAVKRNYDVSNDSTARSMASENLAKPNVREYLESKAEIAAEIIFELAKDSENDGVRLGASKDIMDRAGYKPIEKVVTMNIEVEADEIVRDVAEQLNAIHRGTSISSNGIETSALGNETQDKE